METWLLMLDAPLAPDVVVLLDGDEPATWDVALDDWAGVMETWLLELDEPLAPDNIMMLLNGLEELDP